MKQLTQDEATRCARACGWLDISEAVYHNWIDPPKNVGDYCTDNLFEPVLQPDGSILGMEQEGIDLDPYLWFPRLWERRRSLECGGVGIPMWSDRTLVEDCLALCAAIEALEGKCRKHIVLLN